MGKRLVVISDLHTGSKFGPAPEDWKFNDGTIAPIREAQKFLYGKYLECVEEFGKPDILVVNGDVTDGIQHLSQGRETWTTEGLEQVRLGEHLVNLWNCKEIYFTKGSNYHVDFQGLPVEQVVAQRTKAKLFGQYIDLTVEGSRCNFSHEIPVSMTSWQYRTTPLAVQLVLDRLQNADASSNLIVRSHAHYFAFVGFSDQLGIVTPGFQGQTPYVAKKFPTMKPKCGVVSIEFPTLDFDYLTFDGPTLKPEVP